MEAVSAGRRLLPRPNKRIEMFHTGSVGLQQRQHRSIDHQGPSNAMCPPSSASATSEATAVDVGFNRNDGRRPKQELQQSCLAEKGAQGDEICIFAHREDTRPASRAGGFVLEISFETI